MGSSKSKNNKTDEILVKIMSDKSTDTENNDWSDDSSGIVINIIIIFIGLRSIFYLYFLFIFLFC